VHPYIENEVQWYIAESSVESC